MDDHKAAVPPARESMAAPVSSGWHTQNCTFADRNRLVEKHGPSLPAQREREPMPSIAPG